MLVFLRLLSACFVAFALQCGGKEEDDINSNSEIFGYNSTGVKWVKDICVGNCGYLIGSCGAIDGHPSNLRSYDSDGRNLTAERPSECPSSPFSIQFTEVAENILAFDISVGPLNADMVGMSFPLDLNAQEHNSSPTIFSAPRSSYEVGCGNSWSSRSGSSGNYRDIPKPCTIPGHGPVGAARFRGALQYGEWKSFRGTVRVEIDSGNHDGINFYNHPAPTYNVEPYWDAPRRGAILHLKGRIAVNVQ